MRHHTDRFAQLLLLAITISSCTCGSEAPPVVTLPTRAPGFQATSAPKPTATQPAPQAPTATSAPPVSPTSETLALPDDFPKDIPVMDGATIAAVQTLGGGAHNVLFSTQAESPQIFDFYKEDLRQKGHEVTQQYQTGGQSFLSFKKGNMVTNVVIAKDPKDPKKRVVGIMYYEEQTTEDF